MMILAASKPPPRGEIPSRKKDTREMASTQYGGGSDSAFGMKPKG